MPYEIATWHYGRRMGRNRHVAFVRKFCSAPFAQIGAKVDLRITARTLEIYQGSQGLSSQLFLPEEVRDQYSTHDADQPAGNRYQPWDAPDLHLRPQHSGNRLEKVQLRRHTITQLTACSFIQRQNNVVFRGFTGSRKSFLGCALAKQACLHRVRAHYIRMPDLAEA